MSSLNKVMIIGHLGRDPETKSMPNGTSVSTVSIATSRNWKDKESGDKREETEWHRVVFYDKLADIVDEYLVKGKLVYVEGRLRTRKWQDKDGVDRYTTEIIANQMTMLGKRSDDDDRGSHDDEGETRRHSRAPAPAPAARKPATTGFDDMDDDIPF
jgi:single-strand DNA-binding protein